VLIVSSRHRLWQRYGADGVFAVERALGDLVAAMAERDMAGTLVYVDDSPLLGHLGVLPARDGSAEAVARTVRDLCARMAFFEEAARYVLLVGDDGIVPFHRLENPSPDGESTVLSDHDYGTEPESGIRPARAVGRLPDAGLGRLLEAIRAAAQAHRRLAAGRAPEVQEAFGYSASVWKRAARSVFQPVGDPRSVRLSPPLAEHVLPPGGLDGQPFKYFNLHGLADSPNWYGQRDPTMPADYPFCPVALRPQDLSLAPGSIVFTEACYGARLGGRSLGDSLALMSLARGALAFVGATGVAYGGLDSSLVAADVLAKAFWEETMRGAAAGEALARAKWRLVADALGRQGYLDSEDEKTVRNFVLYGDPSLVHHAPSLRAEDGVDGAPASGLPESAGPADAVGLPPVRPHSPTAGASPDDLVERVRASVARRLPELAGADVQVSTEMLPHTAGRKSVVDLEAGTMMLTLSKSLPTSEGVCYREVVRVTVDGAGRIRKLTLSR
jgi:hypothetical protein